MTPRTQLGFRALAPYPWHFLSGSTPAFPIMERACVSNSSHNSPYGRRWVMTGILISDHEATASLLVRLHIPDPKPGTTKRNRYLQFGLPLQLDDRKPPAIDSVHAIPARRRRRPNHTWMSPPRPFLTVQLAAITSHIVQAVSYGSIA